MHTHIYHNSYIVAVASFIVLSAVFYFLKIGGNTEIVDGKEVKKFSWKYPLAISLVIWLVWHFYLYPQDGTHLKSNTLYTANLNESDKLADQKIIMNEWV